MRAPIGPIIVTTARTARLPSGETSSSAQTTVQREDTFIVPVQHSGPGSALNVHGVIMWRLEGEEDGEKYKVTTTVCVSPHPLQRGPGAEAELEFEPLTAEPMSAPDLLLRFWYASRLVSGIGRPSVCPRTFRATAASRADGRCRPTSKRAEPCLTSSHSTSPSSVGRPWSALDHEVRPTAARPMRPKRSRGMARFSSRRSGASRGRVHRHRASTPARNPRTVSR